MYTNRTKYIRLTTTFHLTLMMTSAQVVETSVTTTDNSPSQDYTHPDDQTTPLWRQHCKLISFTRWYTANLTANLVPSEFQVLDNEEHKFCCVKEPNNGTCIERYPK